MQNSNLNKQENVREKASEKKENANANGIGKRGEFMAKKMKRNLMTTISMRFP